MPGMKVSREQVARNRARIVEQAGRLLRERGLEAVSVAEVMQAAGLTHGAFYGYFDSRDALVAAALEEANARSPPIAADLAAQAARYLAPGHRQNRAGGCPTAALAGEVVRAEGDVRRAMTADLRRRLAALALVSPGRTAAQRRQAAVASWSAMVGALVLARMSDDAALGEEILDQTRRFIGAHARADER